MMNEEMAVMAEPNQVRKRIIGPVFINMMHCQHSYIVRFAQQAYFWYLALLKNAAIGRFSVDPVAVRRARKDFITPFRLTNLIAKETAAF